MKMTACYCCGHECQDWEDTFKNLCINCVDKVYIKYNGSVHPDRGHPKGIGLRGHYLPYIEDVKEEMQGSSSSKANKAPSKKVYKGECPCGLISCDYHEIIR